MDSGYSRLERSMRRMAEDAERQQRIQPVAGFTARERTPAAAEKRRESGRGDFWSFDAVYFPPDMYPEGYHKPSSYHRGIAERSAYEGVILEVGPRGFGKTITELKILVWRLLTGRTTIAAIYSETLAKSSSLLDDIATIIADNGRIQYDYAPEILIDNVDRFEFRTIDGKVRTVAPFGEGRSVRGFVRMFGRPQYIYCDDIETLQSSFTDDQVALRIARLNEAFASLTPRGTMVISANDFDERCATHILRQRYDDGLLASHWIVHVARAWERGRSLWPARYPARSEDEMRVMVRAADEVDYQNNYNQNPTIPEGGTFDAKHVQWYNALPRDARGVAYVDPNLALKAKGDTTAIVVLMYSSSTDTFYVRLRCRSYADAGDLLSDALDMCDPQRVRGLAMDGNVNQESHWTNHIRSWARLHQRPYPTVAFKRYRTDELATNCQTVWNEGRICFDESLRGSEEMTTALRQIVQFTSKKARRKDDAPDSLICAYQFITERGLVRAAGRPSFSHTVIPDHY